MIDIQEIVTDLIKLNPISKSDVEFIYDLRTKRKNNQLKEIPEDINEQYKYFDKYYEEFKKGNEIYYKIINLKNQKTTGVVRILNIKDQKNLNWNSFITTENTMPFVGIEVCFTIYRLTFEILKKDNLGPGLIKASNTHMKKFHDYMEFVEWTDADDLYQYFYIFKKRYLEKKDVFLNLGFGKIKNLELS